MVTVSYTVVALQDPFSSQVVIVCVVSTKLVLVSVVVIQTWFSSQIVVKETFGVEVMVVLLKLEEIRVETLLEECETK